MITRPLASNYAWTASNRDARFQTWEEEIEHMKMLGYNLVPANYYLPHWQTALQMGDALPKIYLLRQDGPDQCKTHFDCHAAQVCYPLYFKTNP